MKKTDKIAALSDIGKKRKNNEDTSYAGVSPYGVLLVVADGMGGHRKGEVASKIVSDSLSVPFANEKHMFTAHRAKKFFHKCLKSANKEIYNMALSAEEYKEMGTTLVSAIVAQKETVVFSVGDSRCYIVDQNDVLKQVTTDQTYVEMLFESGRITKEEMSSHPQKNLLVNAVGITPDVSNVEEYVIKNEDYKTLFLCSDGLYNMVSDKDIEKTLTIQGLTTKEKAKSLLKQALNNGGNDNIAIVIWEN
ncbi:MAG: Stp1/IreP family PP2C-type Ser/Thr phosphatase [Bacilli bacterium]|nr:Stp1/IreP family PP2C-type Ser/Thr phosphatase [Bacilli bacterium]